MRGNTNRIRIPRTPGPGAAAALLIFLVCSSGFAENRLFTGGAAAPAGGYDTLQVYISTDSTYPAAEVTLRFDPEKLRYVEGSFRYNQAAWNPAWGEPIVKSYPNGLKLAFISLSRLDARLPRTDSLRLCTVILGAAKTLKAGDKVEIQTEGMLTNSAFQEIYFDSGPVNLLIVPRPEPQKKKK
jgi:hypothetical protein